MEQHIGNPQGRIAIWCDETEAIEIAERYDVRDIFRTEVMQAVERAYPKDAREEGSGEQA